MSGRKEVPGQKKLEVGGIIHKVPFSFRRSRSRLSQLLRAASVRTHLVQCCLGNRVVLDTEPLFIGHHQLKYPGQGGGGDLVLQRVVVLLPLDAAGEGALHEALHGLQVRGRARLSCLDFHGHYVAVAESGRRKRSVETWITIHTASSRHRGFDSIQREWWQALFFVESFVFVTVLLSCVLNMCTLMLFRKHYFTFTPG